MGVEILKKGGNAVDTAIAVSFALAVVWPEAGNLGGGGFLVLRTARGENAALDFRETAPRAAARDMYLGPDGKPTDRSLQGHLASGVPGTVSGLWEAHRRYGRMPWRELLAPAIHLAQDGVVVSEALHRSIDREKTRLSRYPASAELFLPNGMPPPVGSRWRVPTLAATLARLAEQGPDEFYRGQTANLLLAEVQRGGGIIAREDLQAYQAKWRAPVVFEYLGHSVISMPPPSSGGIVLALIAKTLEGDNLAAMGFHSVDAVHLQVEAMRRAFALRNAQLGDPDQVALTTSLFLGPTAGVLQRRSISMTRATPSGELRGDVPAGEPPHTTHLSIVDTDGAAVALSTTLNGSFGSAVTVADAGFLLNNEMDDFATAPGRANLFGLVQGERNAIAPGKRMLSSMTPTIVLDANRRVRIVTGAAGGPTIITAVWHILTNLVDHKQDVHSASQARRFHHQHFPDEIRYESGAFTSDVAAALQARGHKLKLVERHLANANTIAWQGGRYTGDAETRVLGGLAAGP